MTCTAEWLSAPLRAILLVGPIFAVQHFAMKATSNQPGIVGACVAAQVFIDKVIVPFAKLVSGWCESRLLAFLGAMAAHVHPAARTE
jgi:hypothetical protein